MLGDVDQEVSFGVLFQLVIGTHRGDDFARGRRHGVRVDDDSSGYATFFENGDEPEPHSKEV